MKKILIPVLSLGLFTSLAEMRAQDPAGTASYAAVQQVQLSPQQLEELVAPIALYPDPLIALILPASTVPTDVVMAARYLKNGGDVNQVDAQNWDPSVKSLTRYPDVLNMMDENLDWTNQLGTAVIAQQGDVMQAIQNQRAKANALGNLSTTPQQQVIVEQQVIQIVPADPQIIYVPQYNPEVVYVERAPSYSPFISFSIGFAMGAWLTNDCDWHNRGFYVNNWGRNGWQGYPRYNNTVNINVSQNNYWRPNTHRPPPRPPYVPNRVSASNRQNIPTFRQPPQGGWNGNNNRAQANQGNRPTGVNPGSPNSQTRPDRANPTVSGNMRPTQNSAGAANPQNTAGQNRPSAFPATGQNNRPGDGNNGQSSRDHNRKDRPADVATPADRPVSQSNQDRVTNQPGRNHQQPAVTPRPQPVTTTPQAVATPQTSPWKNSQPTRGTSQGQPQRSAQQTSQPQSGQRNWGQQSSGNSRQQQQPRPSSPQPAAAAPSPVRSVPQPSQSYQRPQRQNPQPAANPQAQPRSAQPQQRSNDQQAGDPQQRQQRR